MNFENDRLSRTNIPITAMSEQNLALYEEGIVTLILHDKMIGSRFISTEGAHLPGQWHPEEGVFIGEPFLGPNNRIIVSLEDLLVNIQSLKLSVVGYGFMGMLPWNPKLYYVGNNPPALPPGSGEYIEIEIDRNKYPRFVDVLKDTAGWGYDEQKKKYVRLEEPERQRNLVRFLNTYDTFKKVGSSETILKDTDRLIAFLFQKVESLLTKEEKALFASYLNQTISADELSRIVDRGAKIKGVTEKYKIKIDDQLKAK